MVIPNRGDVLGIVLKRNRIDVNGTAIYPDLLLYKSMINRTMAAFLKYEG